MNHVLKLNMEQYLQFTGWSSRLKQMSTTHGQTDKDRRASKRGTWQREEGFVYD